MSPNSVIDFLSQTIGLDPESVGRKSILGAIDASMKDAAIDDPGRYIQHLRSDPEEWEKLLARIVVPETWFFRDEGAFAFLVDHLKDKGHPGPGKERLRILSAPCSTGEEPYSIAMVLLEMGMSPEAFLVDAIDISHYAVEAAKLAVYGKSSFRETRYDYEERYFVRAEDGFRLVPSVAQQVAFSTDNLARPGALGEREPYHIVFCKNLMIYLSTAGRKAVLDNIGRLLVPGGLIFAGHSEVMSLLHHGFIPVKRSRAFACIKTESGGQKSEVRSQRSGVRGQKPGEQLPGHSSEHIGSERCVHARRNPRCFPVQSLRETRDRGVRDQRPAQGSALNVERRTSNVEHRTSNVERRTSNPTGALLAEIRALADRGGLEEAGGRCREFLLSHRHDKEGLYLMGLIELALGSFAEAQGFFEKVLYLDPNHYDALVQMKILYERRGDQVKAAAVGGRISRLGGSEK